MLSIPSILRTTWISAAFLALVSCALPPTVEGKLGVKVPVTQTISITVSAATSLQDALKEIQPIYEEANPSTTVVYNFASSGALQQQIEQGAPVDVFLSASPKQIDALETKELLLANSRRNLVENAVVLITPLDKVSIKDFDSLKGNQWQWLAIGEPSSVPAGEYSKEILESFNIYDLVQPKLIFAKDVRQVLSYVETGNVDAGLVYSTDAQTSDRVRVVATAPTDSHSPIIYPGAAIANSPNPDVAVDFLNFLGTQEAIAIFTNYGFQPITP